MNALTASALGQIARVLPAQAPRRIRGKRGLDLTATLLALPVLFPVFLILGLAVKLTSRGPVFFIQTRVGQGGKPFGMIKFRSMVADAEARRAEIMTASDRQGPCLKVKDDPRVTGLGRILRRASLDELPQLINVLKGEMSLVGPRPSMPEEVAAFPVAALERLAVLPGISGAWQVAGRADLSFDEMVALDIDYVRNATLLTDLRLLLRTLRVVVTARGAY